MKKVVYCVGERLIAVVARGHEVIKCWELNQRTFDLPIFREWIKSHNFAFNNPFVPRAIRIAVKNVIS